MMNKKRAILTLCLTLCLVLVMAAGANAAIIDSGACGENLTWTLDDEGTLTISGTGEMWDWTDEVFAPWKNHRDNIKKVIVQNGVTDIGNWAFYNSSYLTSIAIPNSITYIGNGAFNCCNSLSSITIPESVTGIGNATFDNCFSLTSISLPNSVTYIGDKAFSAFLSAIIIDDDNPNYCTENDVLFNKTKTKLIWCPSIKSGSYTIPDSVTSIGNYAFDACSLTSVTMPESVKSIGDYAFFSCNALISITLPEGVTNMGNSVFRDCRSLSSITIPKSVTSIGNDAFGGCDSLKAINVDDGNSNYSSENGVLFNNNKTVLICCPGGKNGSYTIPNTVTDIEDSAFSGCYSLTSVAISNSVKSIGDYAFSWCQGLNSIEVPNSVTSIGNEAFSHCYNLTSITLSDKITNIEDATFLKCGSLATIIVPKGVTSIGNWAFQDCDSLTSITIPNSVMSIAESAFDIFTWDNGTYSNLQKIHYSGTKEQWDKITIHNNNKFLESATIHFNSSGGAVTTGVTLNKTTLSLEVGKSETLTATVTPADATNKNVTWKSSDTAVATVDNNGKVTAVKAGKATITVTTADGGKTATCEVTVTAGTTPTPDPDPNPDPNPNPGPTPNPDPNPFRFDDVKDNKAFYYDAVYWAVNHDPQITKGLTDTTFGAGETCTRAQVVTFLWRAKGQPEPKSTNNPFTDVKSSDYFYKAVLWAVENGVTEGMTKTTFGPKAGCTRGQVVTFLWRAEGKPAATGKNVFTDVKSGAYYYDAVLWAVGKDITKGTSADKFSPNGTCTRGQIVTFLYRDLAK